MKKFKKIYVEITNVCNLACDFCPKTQRNPEFMNIELFERILKQMQGRTKFLYFHLKGEPFLHPELNLFLDLSEKYGYTVNLTTNGTLLDESMVPLINKRALRQINISLHSFNGNENKYSMDIYLDRIFKFINKALSVRNIQFCLRLWNLSDIKDKETNEYCLRKIEAAFNLSYKLEDKITRCNGINLVDNVFLNQSRRFEWTRPDGKFVSKYGFCNGLRGLVGFLVDGTVVPCCIDGEGILNLGNIRTRNFDDILNDKRAKDFYDGFSQKQIVEDFCQKCSFRKRF